MSNEKQIDIIAELLIDFDEMGFAPTTTVPDPEAYAIEWRNKLTEALQGYRKQRGWISVGERLPTVEENENGLVGIVNGYNGKIRFADAIILVDYCFEEKEWWSQDYDLTDCKVEYWMPLPEAPKMKGGAE